MLSELRVRGLALVESAEIRLAPGLNVVTGATGAGKSLLLQALTLLLGGRWSREMMRTGAERMRVEGVFELASRDRIAAVHELLGRGGPEEEGPEGEAPDGPTEVLISRQIDASGRNRCEIDGNLVAVGTLKALGGLLSEIHGQSEHQALLDSAWQTDLLDRAAGLIDQRKAFAADLSAWRDARDRLRSAADDADERLRRIADLDAVSEEVAAVAPEPGEGDALRAERELLSAAEKHRDRLSEALALVADSGMEGDSPAIDRVGRAARELEGTASLSSDARAAVEALDAASDQLQEAWRLIERALQSLEPDPDRLDRVQERLEELGALLRRHGPSEEDALRSADAADAEAQRLRSEERDAGELAARVAELAAKALAAGRSLDAERLRVGADFSIRVQQALQDLEMGGTRFAVHAPERGDSALETASSLGLGPIAFLVSPNVGEDLRPLAKIASGGELARTALAIKGELAGADAVPLLAFDEIDADVGPRLGPVIGRRLSLLARGRQVLVITHLPQVAAHADLHLRVTKSEEGGRTSVQVEAVSGAAREQEIAEMIRGPGRAAEALDQARDMLVEAAAGGAP